MKAILYVLGFVCLLLVGGVLLLPRLVPMETLAVKAKEQVKLATGRDMNFSGVKFVFWPNLGLELTGVTLSNPDWAQEKNMLTLGKADVALALKPLLWKKIEIKRFALEAPAIHLEIGANGKRSWDFSPDQPRSVGEVPGVPHRDHGVVDQAEIAAPVDSHERRPEDEVSCPENEGRRQG